MAPSFRLVTLGPPALLRTTRPGDDGTIFGPSKPLAVITYLALAVGQRASRDRLIDLLWSDIDPGRVRQTLRQTTWQIRHRLGHDVLAGERDELALCVKLSIDRDEFLAALSAGELERAVGLYTGSFFASFAAPGAVEFEHWADLERERLRANYREALETLARRQLASGRFREARDYAVALRDDDPAREGPWRLLLECLLAAGDAWNVGVEAASLERLLADSDRPGEAATLRLLAACRETEAPLAHVERPLLGVELIGREAEFATILETWEGVRSGAGRHLRVAAAAGLGKTRLLRDVRNRLAAAGASVVLARAQPAERHLAYAYAAEIATGVSELPGAIGVSPEAASALVALAPATSSRFHVPADPATGEEALRRRAFAVDELLAAVSEERPVALLLDDVHWADPSSAVILEAFLQRIGETHILAVTAERPGSRAVTTASQTATLQLRALTESDCEDVMTSSGALPDEPWARTIGARLAATTGGSPLLLLETLQLCLDNRWLVLEGGWRRNDPDGLESALLSGTAVRRRIEALQATDASLLTLIAGAGTPVAEKRLASAAMQPRPDVVARLEHLELHGFVARSARGWEVSHDEIAVAALARISDEELRQAHCRLGLALVADEELDVPEYPLAAYHLIHGAAEEQLTGLYIRYLQAVPGPPVRQRDKELALAMLGEDATGERVIRLLEGRPWARRIGLRRVSVAVGVVVGLMAVAVLVRESGAPSPPTQAAFVVAPVEADPTLVPSPVIELQDDQGRRATSAGDTVYADVPGGQAHLVGQTALRANHGRAIFEALDLILSDSAQQLGKPVIVRFWAKGLRPVEWSPTSLPRPALFLERGTLNQQILTPPNPSIVVTVGDSISGDLHLRYTSPWSAASVLLGGTSTWGDKRSNYFTIKPLVTPLKDGRQHIRIRLEGPSRPGRYHLIVLFQAETDVKFIASGTNWTVGHPVWDDGNDVADWSPTQLTQANALGQVSNPVLRVPQGSAPAWVPATAIEVVAKP